MTLCDVMCMKPDCVVMLSCCRCGLNQVVYSLFSTCGKIGYIIGPRQSLDPKEMAISFSLFLFNREFRDLDPIVACEKIKCGTDIRFVCFDSLETRGEAGFIHFQRKNFGDDESQEQFDQVTASSEKVIKKIEEWREDKHTNGVAKENVKV